MEPLEPPLDPPLHLMSVGKHVISTPNKDNQLSCVTLIYAQLNHEQLACVFNCQ